MNIKTRPCPRCGVKGQLDILVKLVANPIGTFSIAGAQTKVTAQERPILACYACKMRKMGRFDVEGKHAVFDAD